MTITITVKQREYGDWIAMSEDDGKLGPCCDDVTPHGAVEKLYRRLGLDILSAVDALRDAMERVQSRRDDIGKVKADR